MKHYIDDAKNLFGAFFNLGIAVVLTFALPVLIGLACIKIVFF